MLTLEQIQDFLGPDILHMPNLYAANIDKVEFYLSCEGVFNSSVLPLQMWNSNDTVPAVGPFGQRRALKALNIGKAVGPLYFIKPFFKCVTYVPQTHLESVREALWASGAGQIGQYSRCSYYAPGTGTFWPEDGTHPFLGGVGVLNEESEMRLEVVVPKWYQNVVEHALLTAHPYEEPAYDWIRLENRLGIPQAYCDGQGEWWFIEDTPELVESILHTNPPVVHCEKISWESRIALARRKISVDIKQPGELLYRGLQKLWGEKKKPWE